ncbi:SufB/SufD family protein [Silvanigrella aquatica]|uniref:SUF system FeS cluster assembly SufBD core domain-containing protein n=1 Tax=Silvanigrella aquatica TaxID=1915309 RepID=A0A1L4CZJ9_9BACT|nr:SufD family Fe-S cluster assembly protein [Silvanigrella aquatica]APJ03370.1 hypothetical protein AXG55_05395 [Silvanigrella aquatica]
MMMTLVELNTHNLPKCPTHPEESWRKTNPETFFLPQNEVLNFQGNSAVESLNNKFLPWKVSYRNSDLLENRIQQLSNIINEDGIQALKLEQHRIILLEIGHGCVDIYASKQLKSNIELISAPFEVQSIAPKSDIGFALASRLKASSPHELIVKLESFGTEVPLVLIANQMSPNFSQCYSVLKFVLADSSQAELALIDGGNQFSYLRHSLELHENAKLTQLWIHNSAHENRNSVTLLERLVTLHENAKLNDAQIMLPQGNTRVTSNIVFAEKRAEAHSAAAVVATTGKFDYEPIQYHMAAQGKSDLNVKMIMSGRARAIFQGLVTIEKNAPQTLAKQNNKNLLLSKNARVDASPRLEILPNDVMCKHGSATGELDAKQLYYMATRGFSLNEARKMIVKSFVAESLINLESETLLSVMAESALEVALSQLPKEI